MLSAVLGARQKQQLHFAPAGHVNTSERCWNFLLSQAASPCRPKTEMKAMASQPPMPHVNPGSPGHALRVGSWSQLVSGLLSNTANVDICLCQMSQNCFPMVSRKCSELPNARVKGIEHSDGSLPLTYCLLWAPLLRFALDIPIIFMDLFSSSWSLNGVSSLI